MATEESLTKQLESILAHGAKLAALLPADTSALAALGGGLGLPDYLPRASATGEMDAGTAAHVAAELSAAVKAYNSDRERAVNRCQERLKGADNAVGKANNRLMAPGVPALPRLPPVDVEGRMAEFKRSLPSLVPITPSLIDSLRRRARKDFLQRLRDILLRHA